MLLHLYDLDVRYDRVHAVRGVSLGVDEGEIVTVLGANGAGKSSMLRAVLGIERPAAGRVIFAEHDITGWTPSRRVQCGLALVPEGRRVIATLTVHENLLMGAFNRRLTHGVMAEVEEVYQRFPNLAARRHSAAAVLSGGEQQMLAIGRALLSAPKLMMLDEPSLGLSPRLLDEVFAHINLLARDKGLSILLVEQNTQRALELADRVYVFELGSMVGEGVPEKFLVNHTLLHAYLGRSATKDQSPQPQTAAS
jgi:branched-chain amino acid transport system ATP-binding protein